MIHHSTRSRETRPAHRAVPKLAPAFFTADGERKWKPTPTGIPIEKNTTGNGTWIERWQLPQKKGATGPATVGKYVYNYTLAEVQRRAGQKFADNRELARHMPEIRAAVAKDLTQGTGKAHQVAMAVSLIDNLYIRVGGEESASEREHYGVTTLEKRHVQISGNTVKLDFTGKSGVAWHVSHTDPKLAKALKAQLETVKGSHDNVFSIHAEDVNAFLKPFGATAKKFRTFHATRMARNELMQHLKAPKSEREEIVNQMFVKVAGQMGHTPAVDREHYVDPMVVQAFMLGKLS